MSNGTRSPALNPRLAPTQIPSKPPEFSNPSSRVFGNGVSAAVPESIREEPDPSDTRSSPIRGSDFLVPAITAKSSMRGEIRIEYGREAGVPTKFSGTPPDAAISRSLSPPSVSNDERNDPVAASPA